MTKAVFIALISMSCLLIATSLVIAGNLIAHVVFG